MPVAADTSTLVDNSSAAKWRAANYWPLFVILAYYLVSIVIVNPIGNFPQNDDWVYGQAARTFMQTGQIDLPTTCSACILHVCLAGAICKLVGFSYTVLRAITLLFGAISAIAAYFVFLQLQVNKKLACIFTLLYLGNPLVLNLCFSFMTDISSFAFINLYFLFLLKGIKNNSLANDALSSACLLAAILVRQGSAVFVVANICLLLMYWLKKKNSWTLLLGLVALPAVLFVSLSRWLMIADRLSDSYIWFANLHAHFLHYFSHHLLEGSFTLLVMLGQVACYYGLYLLPVLVPACACLASLFARQVKVAAIWFVLSSAVIVGSLTKLMLVDKLFMPFNENMLRIPIVGAPNLLGISIPKLSAKIRFWLTNIAGFFGFVLLSLLAAGAQRAFALFVKALPSSGPVGRQRRAFVSMAVFAAMGASVFAVVMETAVLNVDRHNLLALMPVLMCLALTWRWLRLKTMPVVTFSLLAVLISYSTMASQDNISWNRARWQSAHDLEAQGIKSCDIDGGAEYDFANDINLWIKTFHNQGRNDNPRNCWRWWRVHDDKYIISFSPVPGYETVASKTYFSALTLSNHQVLTLKRLEGVK